MYPVALDIWRDDCPLSRASADHDVTFPTPYWNYSPDSHQWELWVGYSTTDRSKRAAGLLPRATEAIQSFELF